jgi:CRISPR-associated protein Cmr5
METLEQERGQAAWIAATRRKNELVKEKAFTAYKNHSKSAPMMIMNSGLMATLAFYQSRDTDPAGALVEDVMRWIAVRKLLDNVKAPAIASREPFQQVMNRLLHAESSVYQQVTVEVLAYLRWLRQFADAVDTQPTPKS